MKIILLSILALSFNGAATSSADAATPGCQEYSGTYDCSVGNPGIQNETKSFSLKDGVLKIILNDYDGGTVSFNLDGQTHSKVNAAGDKIDTTASCIENQSAAKEVISVQGYEHDFNVLFIDANTLRFSDLTTSQNTSAYSLQWKCLKQ